MGYPDTSVELWEHPPFETLSSPMQITAAHETLLTLPFRQRAQQQLPFSDTTAERAADVQPYLPYWQVWGSIIF